MITHAGLGSVKECIRAGVPMLAIPLAMDQHANARRIAQHRLGNVLSLDHATNERLTTCIDDALTSVSIRDGIDAMRRAFESVEAQDTGADVIESVASRRPLPPNSPRTLPATAR